MTEQSMVELATALGIWIGAIALLALVFFSINYRITKTRLLITILGIPIRSIRIRDIRHMGTEPKAWAERWYNTLTPANRRLVIRRKSGLLCKTVIVTPKNPYHLMHDLEKAKSRIKAEETTAEGNSHSAVGMSR